jgi:steroid delta-isomerase-like uncharacterized protein
MSETDHTNEELVRGYLRAFNDRDRDAIADHLADGVVEHGVYEELHGVDEIFEFFSTYFDPFPDYTGTTEAMIVEGDTVAVRYTASGTHTGEFQDVEPTGQTVEWSGLAMYRIEDGEIAEIWIEEDRLGLLEKLEVVSRPAHLRI